MSLELPHLPDMLFKENVVKVENATLDMSITFDAVSALERVDARNNALVRVAAADVWQNARKECLDAVKDVVKPYDWTFTPRGYKGRVEGAKADVVGTSERIDYEKLKRREKILFFDEVILYEDELDDNGSAVLNVKIRVMPSGFFLLSRFYLRVDDTLVRVVDTRLHFEVGNDFALREYTEREATFDQLKHLPLTVVTDANEVVPHLDLKEEVLERIRFNAN